MGFSQSLVRHDMENHHGIMENLKVTNNKGMAGIEIDYRRFPPVLCISGRGLDHRLFLGEAGVKPLWTICRTNIRGHLYEKDVVRAVDVRWL
jgi:hypothetical protein